MNNETLSSESEPSGLSTGNGVSRRSVLLQWAAAASIGVICERCVKPSGKKEIEIAKINSALRDTGILCVDSADICTSDLVCGNTCVGRLHRQADRTYLLETPGDAPKRSFDTVEEAVAFLKTNFEKKTEAGAQKCR